MAKEHLLFLKSSLCCFSNRICREEQVKEQVKQKRIENDRRSKRTGEDRTLILNRTFLICCPCLMYQSGSQYYMYLKAPVIVEWNFFFLQEEKPYVKPDRACQDVELRRL